MISSTYQKLVRKMFGFKPYSSRTEDEYDSDGSEMIFLVANENPFEKRG